MSVEGILGCEIVRGGVNADKFYDFAEQNLLPTLLPFDGYNHHSVVILDNCAIHHTDDVVQVIRDSGALVHFLPPYSPDMNPTEEAFSKVKALMRAMENEMQALQDIDTIVYAAFSSITTEDCKGWIADATIYK